MKKRILIVALISLVGLLFLGTTNTNTHKRSHMVYEEALVVEDWMTKPFVETIEEPLEVEEWMCKPFQIN